MLSLFPDLLDWSWYAPLLFRLFLGMYCCVIAWTLKQNNTEQTTDDDRIAWTSMRILLFLLGLLFIVGVGVQALGAVGFVLALFALHLRRAHSPYVTESVTFYLLIGIVALSLTVLGAGPHAFDLPL